MDLVPEEVLAGLIVPLLSPYERQRLWAINRATANVRNYVIIYNNLLTREERTRLVKAQAMWRSRMVSARVRMIWALSNMGEVRITHKGIARHGQVFFHKPYDAKTIAVRHRNSQVVHWSFANIWKSNTVFELVESDLCARFRYRNCHAPFTAKLSSASAPTLANFYDNIEDTCQLASYVYLFWSSRMEPAFQEEGVKYHTVDLNDILAGRGWSSNSDEEDTDGDTDASSPSEERGDADLHLLGGPVRLRSMSE